MIFVCTNARADGQRISCAGEGRCGGAVLDRLKSFVKAHGLEGRVRVAKSGCQERCESGPNAVVFPDNAFFSGLGEADADRLVDRFLRPLLP